MSRAISEKIQKEIESRKAKNLFRSLSDPVGIDFCSNDYLGLSKNPQLIQAFEEGIRRFGLGSTASRLVRGHRGVFSEFEKEFSEFVGAGESLLLANGFIANLGLIEALADIQTIIFTDRLNHASILDGIRISGAKRVYYPHNNLEKLESELKKHETVTKKIIVTESIFSMDGDSPDLDRLVSLKEKFDACLILDETHALGVVGVDGSGLARDPDFLNPSLVSKIDVRIFTLGKAMGLEGGILSLSNPDWKDYFINCLRGFIYSTAILPAIPYAGMESIRLCKNMDPERKHLRSLSDQFRSGIEKKSYPRSDSSSQIVPVLIPEERQALEISDRCQSEGLDVRAIRPPTVPSPRLRISIHSDRTKEDIEALLAVL